MIPLVHAVCAWNHVLDRLLAAVLSCKVFVVSSFRNRHCQACSSERTRHTGRSLGGMTRNGSLEFAPIPKVEYLRLDYNHIGAQGVEQLAKGLAQNPVLRFAQELR